MDQTQINSQAYLTWKSRYYEYQETDRNVSPFLSIEQSGPSLREARNALLLTVKRAAANLGVSHVAYTKLERRCDDETIPIASLKTAAQALGCELVYGIRPKSRSRYSECIWQTLLPYVLADKMIEHLSHWYKVNAMAKTANMLLNDADFRRKLGYSERGNLNEYITFRRIDRSIVKGITNSIM